MPRDGYTAMFERMLAHPNIEVRLKTDYREARAQVAYDHLIYTGPLDEYFDHCHGPLPYRSLRFEPETIEREFFQPVVQVNYPNDHDFTRIVEIKHATGQQIPVTTIVREYPQDYLPGREAYYPLPAPDAQALYKKYEALAHAEPHTSFVGRMATYRYYNMDQVVGMALAEFDRLKTEARGPAETITSVPCPCRSCWWSCPSTTSRPPWARRSRNGSPSWNAGAGLRVPGHQRRLDRRHAAAAPELREQLGPRLEILDRENRGHGQSCLQGYRIARERGVPWVFQIDSDGQCDPRFFEGLWQQARRLRRGLRIAGSSATTAGSGW